MGNQIARGAGLGAPIITPMIEMFRGVSIARRGDSGLMARIAEGGFAPLTPVRQLVFRLAGTTRVEFTPDGRMVTPSGEFTRVT